MSDVKFILPGPETVSISGQTVDKLLRAGDGDAALLYLYILKTDGKGTAAEAAAVLGRGQGAIEAAMAVLSRLALIRLDYGPGSGPGSRPGGDPAGAAQDAAQGAVGGEARRYTVEDIKNELETGSTFCALVEEAQRSLGKILSPDELMKLFGMYDSLQMAPEVIMLLITYCISESRERGCRMPSMREIEKEAYAWEREGILTLDRAEEHIRALEERKSARGEIKRALQIRDRDFSKSEKRYADKWTGMGFGAEAIAIAYDKTILNTGKLAWSYMDKIITKWYDMGLRTPQDIDEKDGSPGKGGAHKGGTATESKFGPANKEDIMILDKLLKEIGGEADRRVP